jgi:hypothetical protein
VVLGDRVFVTSQAVGGGKKLLLRDLAKERPELVKELRSRRENWADREEIRYPPAPMKGKQ